jgi:hypothetical protein
MKIKNASRMATASEFLGAVGVLCAGAPGFAGVTSQLRRRKSEDDRRLILVSSLDVLSEHSHVVLST